MDTDGMGSLQVRFTTATMKIRANRTAGLGQTDLEILQEHKFQNFDEYWLIAISQEMEMTEFIRLLEAHLLDPQGFADEVHQRRLPIGRLIEHSLNEAWENGETWFVGRGPQAEYSPLKLRLRPREAAEWILQRPLQRDRLPATLRAYLESKRPQGKPLDRRAALAPANVSASPTNQRRRNVGRSRERRDLVMKILQTKYPPHGQPPRGRPRLKILKEVNAELQVQEPPYEIIAIDTLRRALEDLKTSNAFEAKKQNSRKCL